MTPATLAPAWPHFVHYLSPFRYFSALIEDANRWPDSRSLPSLLSA